MSARLVVLEAIAVLVGAVIALVLTDVVAWIFFDTSFVGFVSSIGRWIVVLVTVGLFAVYYAKTPPTAAAIASFFTGVGLPLIAEKIVFGSSLPLGSLLFLFVVFSVVALFTYRFVHANGAVRNVAGEITRSDGPSTRR